MPNRNSKTNTWSPVRRSETKAREAEALRLRGAGLSVKDIARRLKRSEARIKEYLRSG